MSVKLIEDRIQKEIIARRVKLYEYFQDKDPGNSGFVSWTHFQHCLSRNLDINLTPNELSLVKEKFDTRRNETFNYRVFCKYVEGMDTWYNQKSGPIKFELSIPHPLQTHTPMLEDSIKELLERLYYYYQSHAIDSYTNFVDVDKTKEGLVPFGQLLRIFQVPNDFSEADVKLIMQKYQSPEKPGYFDYITFNNELEFVGLPSVVRFRDTQRFRSRSGILDLEPPHIVTISIKDIIDRVIRAMYKYNVHVYDFLQVYDPPRAGIITDKQFSKGLWLALGTETPLTQQEIQVLAQFFRNKDGFVPYREFCNVVDSALIPPFLEKNDAGKMCRMDMGHPKDNLQNRLSEEEERTYQTLVRRIAREVDTKQLQMFPSFEDCENKLQFPGLIVASDFNRVIQKFDIDLSPGESQLLCRKYEDPTSGGIHYRLFLQDVDRGFQRFRIYNDDDVRLRDLRSYTFQPSYKCGPHELDDVFTTLQKIRHHVLTKRLRISEFYRDYDHTRVGSIPERQFVRGLDLLLVGALSPQCRISPEELRSLLIHYRDPTKPENILWRKFEIDVDAVFVTRDLEKNPDIRPEPAAHINGHLLQDPIPMWTTVNHASVAIEKLRLKIRQQNINILQYFQDFDKAHSNRVTVSIFDRVMLHCRLCLPEDDFDAIRAVYSDGLGFNYVKFTKDLQPEQQDFDRHAVILAMLKARWAAQQTRHPGTYIDLIDLLFRLRSKMRKSRLILFEYLKDHDKQNLNRLSKPNFRRALSLATFELSEREYEILECSFECADTPDQIDLLLFYDTINSVMVIKNLEKTPLATPFLFQAEPDVSLTNLGPEEDKLLWSAMHRLGRRLHQRQVFMEPFFEDLDPTNTGLVSRTQFRRALSAMHSYDHVISNEEFEAVTKRFRTVMGGRKDVNYRAFLAVLHHISRTDHAQEFWR